MDVRERTIIHFKGWTNRAHFDAGTINTAKGVYLEVVEIMGTGPRPLLKRWPTPCNTRQK